MVLADKIDTAISYAEHSIVQTQICDFCNTSDLSTLFAEEPYDIVIHLAAIVSGQAEKEFKLGYKVNVDSTRNILDSIAVHADKKITRFFMTSSVAVFGGVLPSVMPDVYPCIPNSSYGVQKAIGELYVHDYSRRGFCDGRVLRLPTITVRSGKPNAAASSFVSSIIREPLHREQALCPVPLESKLWICSPSHAINSLLYIINIGEKSIENNRVINPKGLTVTVQEMIDALVYIKGKDILKYITFTHDSFIEKIVLSWPSQFESSIAHTLHFPDSKSIIELIKEYIQYSGL